MVRWILLAADLLLLSLAWLVVVQRSEPLSFWGGLLCFSALAIGAVLALLALLGSRKGSL